MQRFVQTVVITFHWSHTAAGRRVEERADRGRRGEETQLTHRHTQHTQGLQVPLSLFGMLHFNPKDGESGVRNVWKWERSDVSALTQGVELFPEFLLKHETPAPD